MPEFATIATATAPPTLKEQVIRVERALPRLEHAGSLTHSKRSHAGPHAFFIQSMIRKSRHRFFEKIMLEQRDQSMIRFRLNGSCSKARF
jgi:hypothetical protein